MAAQLLIKRILDVLFAFIGIIVLSLLFVVIGCCIKATSKGPILFKQARLGKNGNVFHIYKFRTMVVGAEHKGNGLFQDADDERITKVGRFLRMTSLDELPQLFNILKGEMSFVGPRPPVTYYPCKFEEYSPEKKRRFHMLPGITGYAQVMGRNALSWDERIEYDLNYIQHFSLWLDMKIIFLTIEKILRRENVYGNDPRRSGKIS
ncbi:sugar transferase [Bacillus sp. REN10]|uniref:sugar transferase n=1 Tax=Bacillus sp. REN10 TaxID=2782541 RepID=UPI00193BF5DD|nr:sugar transferase [Bacillus sp. REN10]